MLSAIEARNRGDIEAYKGFLTGEGLALEIDVHVAEALSYAKRNTELADCRVTGTDPGGATIVECESSDTDDFRRAGGIVDTRTTSYLVTEDDKITGTESGDDVPWPDTEFGMFNSAFWAWLMDAYPAVFDDIGPPPASRDSIPGLNWPANRNFGVEVLHEADEMFIALDHVAEFVAQSDAYPINP